MGKSKKPKVEVSFYYMSLHYGICQAEPDALLEIKIREKSAWSAGASSAQKISISERELFGGDQKEGGAIGTAYYLPGSNDQLMPTALAQKLGRSGSSDCPGFRGLASLFFYRESITNGFYWSANAPFVPGVWAKIKRILKRSDGSVQWYSEKAAMPVPGEASLIGGEVAAINDLWKYKTESPGSTADYSSPSYNDSAWSEGTGGFGNRATGIGVPNPGTILFGGVSPITAESIVWIRKNLGQLAQANMDITVYHDDGVTVWFNGTEIALTEIDYYTAEGTISGALVNPDSDNIIAIKVTDSIPAGTPTQIFAGADIEYSGDVGRDMNPAHIIHECLTDTTWGMGTPLSALDDTAFRAAADTLFTEGLGLSMIWTRQATIETFIQEVLDHIQGVLYLDPLTGLLVLDLIRDDYDAGTLDVIDPDNADLTNFSRKLWGEIVNEIVVTWTNPTNEQQETVTVQDDASIATQGIVSDSRNYYGVRSRSLAQDLAFRDLRSAGQPLLGCTAEVDRTQYDVRPGGVIKLTWPEYGVSELVMRIQTVDYGAPGDPTIRIEMIEDVYGLDIGSYGNAPGTSWTDPAADPVAITDAVIITMPYFFALGSQVNDFVDSPTYAETVMGLLVTASLDDAWAYELWDELTLPDASVEYTAIATNNIIGKGTLVASLLPEVSSTNVALSATQGDTGPQQGGFVIIGDGTEATDEICLITADNGDGTFTIDRGCLDTVPRLWAAGTSIWFIDEDVLWEDPQVRSGGEVVDYKLLMRTSRGLFDLATASEVTYTATDRPWLPNRPANVTAYGEAFSTSGNPVDATANPDAFITVTWAIRNRLDEENTVLAWDDGSGTAESGQTTTIEVRDIDGVLLATHDGLAGTSYNVPDSSYAGEQLIELRVYSERSDADGDFVSLQYFSHWVLVTAATFDSTIITFDNATLKMDQN